MAHPGRECRLRHVHFRAHATCCESPKVKWAQTCHLCSDLIDVDSSFSDGFERSYMYVCLRQYSTRFISQPSLGYTSIRVGKTGK